MQRLSIRAYAHHRGVSNTAVHQAIKTGRISQEPDGSIDPEKADEQWERNTRPHNGCPVVPQEAIDTIKAILEEHDVPTDNLYLQARVANDILRAQRRHLAEHVEQAECIDCKALRDDIADLARTTHQAWLNWSVRVAAPIAHELGIDDYFFRILLTDYVREHLAELAENTDNLDGDAQPRH